jgi:hypothetical protein
MALDHSSHALMFCFFVYIRPGSITAIGAVYIHMDPTWVWENDSWFNPLCPREPKCGHFVMLLWKTSFCE